MKHCIQLCLLWTLLVALPAALAISCSGCVDLDELNFDQTIERFPYALVKFDIAFPYGEKHEAFAALSKAAHKVTKELLVATVGIKDYGELENKALGDRFNVDDKQFPGIFLFLGNAEKYVQFPAYLDVTLDNLKAFVSDNTPLYIGRDGCIKEFSDAVKVSPGYANLANSEQLKLIEKFETQQTQLKTEEQQQNAKVYLTFMRKINELGYEFLEPEVKRLQRLKAGKVTAEKKVELQRRLNVLETFRVNKLTKAKNGSAQQDEL